MANQLAPFKFQSHELRVQADESGNPWFCAKDVCAILGYANDRKTVKDHCKSEGVTNRYPLETSGGTQYPTFISEGNLYRLIIKSNKPEAEPFEAWVCDEILPAIRKTGSYFPAIPAGPLTLKQFGDYQAAIAQGFAKLHQAQADLMAAPIQLTGHECLTLNLTAAVLDAAQNRSAAHKATQIIVQMAAEGRSRGEIVAATGKTYTHVRQVIFHARRDGLLPEAPGGEA